MRRADVMEAQIDDERCQFFSCTRRRPDLHGCKSCAIKAMANGLLAPALCVSAGSAHSFPLSVRALTRFLAACPLAFPSGKPWLYSISRFAVFAGFALI